LWRRRFIAGILAADSNREIELRYLAENSALSLTLFGKARARDAQSAVELESST